MLCVCQQLASTVQYLELSLLLLFTSASDLPMRTIKFCSVVFGVTLCEMTLLSRAYVSPY